MRKWRGTETFKKLIVLKNRLGASTWVSEVAGKKVFEKVKNRVTPSLEHIENEIVKKFCMFSSYSRTKQRLALLYRRVVSENRAADFACKFLTDSARDEAVAAKNSFRMELQRENIYLKAEL